MPRSGEDLALVDTNVLVESVLASAPHHQASAALLERAQAGELQLCHRGQMSGASARAPKGGQALVEAPGIEPGSARRPVSPRSRA